MMSPDNSTGAHAQTLKAKKTLQSASGGFSFFSNKEDKYQNAAELYIQAANAYRLENMSTLLRSLVPHHDAR